MHARSMTHSMKRPGRGRGPEVGIHATARRWMLRLALVALGAALALSAAACGDDEGGGGYDVPEGCNPLSSNWDCLLPYPTDFYLVEDSAMPSGMRVEIPEAALPMSEEAGVVDFLAHTPADGFGILPPILALFPFELSDENLVFWTDDVFESTGPDSPTVLLEADTGTPVLHFAELDPRAQPGNQALLIRPLDRLEHGVRYIVAIRSLQQDSGEPVPPAEGFRRLRDGSAGGHPVLSQLVDHYESRIFAPLQEAGVERSALQLAWDFTTATEEHTTQDLLRVRELTLESLDASAPAAWVTEVDEDYDVVSRRVRGMIEVPLFMESEEPGAYLHRGADGQVAANGTTEFEFSVIIPRSVGDASPTQPARLLQFGHGFFGDRREMEGSFVRSFADRTGMVVIGIDWWGMSTPDLPDIIEDIMTNVGETLRFTERAHQGMANQLALVHAAKTTLTQLPELQDQTGQLYYDPEEIYYYGISQGHILGGTYVALSPELEHIVFSVGACSFPFMMFRSANFVQFLGLIEIALPDRLDQQKFVALAPTVFERIDPITYAPYVLQDPLPGSPDRTLLMQIGIGDPQVPNVASHVHARALGLSHLQPAPRDIPGLPPVEGTVTESALVEFDFNLSGEIPGTYAIPTENTEGNPVHEGVRRLDASIEQIDAFLRPGGVITNTCDGPCDPE